MTHIKIIAGTLQKRPFQIEAAIQLLDKGNTIPFIARYRKEATGSLDETELRQLADLLHRHRTLDERRDTILASIEAQDKLTPELKARILAAETLTALEDIYRPYKPKRRTRASVARDKGLAPLAELIIAQSRTRQTPAKIAAPFIGENVPTVADALAGARDIVAEMISDHAGVRALTREKALQYATLHSEKIADAVDEKRVYELYYDYNGRVNRLQPHQILALNRGETEKILRVHIDILERDWLLAIRTAFRPDRRSPLAEQLQLALEDAAQRLLLPAIERDVRRVLTEHAETHAIEVFATNLRGLLSQPPLARQTILAIDPGYRTGSKIAVVDATGRVLDTHTIYPHPPQNERDDALKALSRLIARHGVTLIAIGNGTASRETEQLVAELTRRLDNVSYLIVNEAGASVYSASALAGQELPDMDVTLRGAVSIARRVQDPLAELVKIDPKSIGIGMYQHDVDQKQLSQALEAVVESVVNQVGVDLNTASPALLTYVSGIGPKLAERIVAYRDKNGRFTNRRQLLEVHGLGSKAFEQSAGFLRIRGGNNPLDASAIHPESYDVATAVLQRVGVTTDAPMSERIAALADLQEAESVDALAQALDTGVPTLSDILEQLVRPGRDPRSDLPPPILRNDVLSMTDLQTGMQLSGTVRNVVDFGAFIDIGVKQDGLLHRSQIPRGVRLTVGDIMQVSILRVEQERGRISLGWAE